MFPAWLLPVIWMGWKMQQDCELCCSLDQGPNRGACQPENQVTFPVARYGPVFDSRWPLAD